MIVISNIKKGIKIPTVEVTINGVNATIASIDKIKYSDFLNLNPVFIFLDTHFDNNYILNSAVRIVEYVGDEITTDMQGNIISYFLSI